MRRLLLIAAGLACAWGQANPVVRTAGTLTSTAVLVGGGSQLASASTLTATVTKMTSGVPSAATAGTDYAAPIASGSAGIAAFNAGTDATAARSDHTHRLIGSVQFHFPGTPSSGVQNMTLMLPTGITNATILNVQAVANTPQSGGTTTLNIQRCTGSCTGTTPTFANIYATGLGMATNLRITDCIGAGTCGALTATAAASDQFKVNLVSVGTALADITVQLIYKYETTN